jgi:N-glycosylase/DNA lyase
MIPIDSRLEKLFHYHSGYPQGVVLKKIKDFYINLSKNLNIPLLHLDAILWVNFEELVEGE